MSVLSSTIKIVCDKSRAFVLSRLLAGGHIGRSADGDERRTIQNYSFYLPTQYRGYCTLAHLTACAWNDQMHASPFCMSDAV
jgi:hypothetical protein